MSGVHTIGARFPEGADDVSSLAATHSPNGLIYFDHAHVARWMNDAARALLGIGPLELNASDVHRGLVLEDGRPLDPESSPVSEALRTCAPVGPLLLGRPDPDAGTAWLEVHARPVLDAEERSVGVVMALSNADVRVSATARLRRLADTEDLYDAAPCGYHSIAADGRILEINRTLADWLGVNRDDVVGTRNIAEFLTPASVERLRQELPALVSGAVSAVEFEVDLVGMGAAPRRAVLRAAARRDAEGRFVCTRSVVLDVLARGTSRSALRPTLREQEMLLQNDQVGIVRLRDGTIEWANLAMTPLFGYANAELVGRPMRVLYPDQEAFEACGALMQPLLVEQGRARAAVELRHHSGRMLWVDIQAMSFEHGEVVCFLTDQTALREAQRVLAHVQRVDAVGRLTGGVAHEFNNLLQIIGAAAELASQEPGNARIQPDLQDIRIAAQRGAELVSQLMTYARKQMVHPVSISVDREAAQAVSDYRPMLQARTTIRATQVTPVSGSVHIDRLSLSIALRNLLDNAADAVASTGVIEVRTGQRTLSADERASLPGTGAGEYAFIAVADNGAGMSADVLAQATEPFFTTHRFGEHRGLGLSSADGIAAQAGGFLTLESEPGRGTTATIFLPIVTEQEEAREPAPAPSARGAALVIDGDPRVRRLTMSMLSRLGYEPIGVARAADAQMSLRAHGDVGLVVTTAMVGDVDARVLVDTLREIRPNLRVVYMSGHDVEWLKGERQAVPRDATVLSKPFTMAELRAAVNSAV